MLWYFYVNQERVDHLYHHLHKCKIDKRKCYRTSRPIKRQLTLYATSRPHGVKKNAMAIRSQSRDSCQSMALLGDLELTKTEKILESKNKNKNENQKGKTITKTKMKTKKKLKTKRKWKQKQK